MLKFFKKTHLKEMSSQDIGQSVKVAAQMEFYGKKSYGELEKAYKKLVVDADKWKTLAQRYYQENKFIKKNVNKKKVSPHIIGYSIIQYLKYLKIPGVISCLLLVNLILLVIIGFFLLKDETQAVSTPKKIEVTEPKEEILPYTIQICVYESFDDAKVLVDKLKQQNLSATINKPLNSRSDVYRVYVGNFQTVKEAQRYLERRIKGEFGNSVVRKRF